MQNRFSCDWFHVLVNFGINLVIQHFFKLLDVFGVLTFIWNDSNIIENLRERPTIVVRVPSPS